MFTEDLAAFFNLEDFAVEATWNGTTAVRGIFDRTYIEPLGVDIVSGSMPRFVCEEGEVDGIAQGDDMVISTTSYKVRAIEPDGTGVVTLRLEEQ